MSEVKVNKISPRSGTDVQLGDSGDTITVPSGATFDASNATTTLPATVVTTDGSQTLTNKTIDASQLTGTITPSDNTVSLAKLTATGTKDATTFLRGDNSFAEVPAGGITEADQWRLTAAISANVNPISSNLERVDNSSFAKIGTGMSVSSGIWSFPSTGLYLVQATSTIQSSSLDNIALEMFVTINNSTYDQVLQIVGNGVQSDCTASQSGIYFVNVTNTSNVKVKFAANSITTGNILASTSINYTSFTFIRLGDSQ